MGLLEGWQGKEQKKILEEIVVKTVQITLKTLIFISKKLNKCQLKYTKHKNITVKTLKSKYSKNVDRKTKMTFM